MTCLTKKFFLLPAFTLILSAMAVGVKADSHQEVVEARQESQIWTTYALSPYLRANDLKVVVHSGKATLTGKVDENVNKELAKEIALGVSGIKEVDNQIVVQADYQPKITVQNYGQVIDDATVTAAVKSRLAWSKNIDSMAIRVETKSGRVALTGTAANSDAKESAGRLAVGTRGGVSVSNQLLITNKSVTEDASQKISDSWITTKVKSTFFYSRNVSGSDIEVATKDRVVALKGRVDSGAERALAIELAQNVRGVKSVSANELKN